MGDLSKKYMGANDQPRVPSGQPGGGEFAAGGGGSASPAKVDRRSLESAHDKLWEPMMEWIHHPDSSGKSPVVDAYGEMTAKEKAALQSDVDDAFRRVHGGLSVTAYRYKNRPGHMGGMSLTTEEPTYLSRDKYTAFHVDSSQVLAHWAQEGSPLSTKSFVHEKELVLKPDANPRQK